MNEAEPSNWLDKLIQLFVTRRGLAVLATLLALGGGLYVMPLDVDLGNLPRNPVAVDAIPDISENQQIVFTSWPGRSPQDVEDQVTYPLTVEMLGVGGVKTVRSQSAFGHSSVHVLFEEDTPFEKARNRILEKLASLGSKLPADARPELGPEATPLGQIFWYTLEGEGFSLHELRSVQDWYVRYALQSAAGVAEVASVGGHLKEYQLEVNPRALKSFGVSLEEVFRAVRRSNAEVGARSIEKNGVEYLVRGVGFLKSTEDLALAVVKMDSAGRAITLGQLGRVQLGPAPRRGALDVEGAEAVGGVVVARYGANPLKVIDAVKAKVAEISFGLPEKTLADGRISKVKIVPFYDRSLLIEETLDTLTRAISLELIVTMLVVLLMLWHLRSALLISGLLPLAVLVSFVAMHSFGVDSHIMSLSGIAIAIGTVVDIGIVISENIVRNLKQDDSPKAFTRRLIASVIEVAPAVLTAIATTIISFIPVFGLTGPEAKLFGPLAFTKTFVLLASVLIALFILPAFAHILLRRRGGPVARKSRGLSEKLPPVWRKRLRRSWLSLLASGIVVGLARSWQPLGLEIHLFWQVAFVAFAVGGLLGGFAIFIHHYPRMLRFWFRHRLAYLGLAAGVFALGVFGWQQMQDEYMPDLDEGAFLFMPTTMPHASVGETLHILQTQDKAIRAVPEVKQVVGKIGRVDSALDPAPMSMVETIINIKPEYGPKDPETGIRPRLWRDHIRNTDDIWREIVKTAQMPGTTSAPKLQPIAARIVMLQSGMRAPIGIKIFGPDLASVEKTGLALEGLLKKVPAVDPATVNAERLVGKPYLEIRVDRDAARQHGVQVADVLDVVQLAVGGTSLTTLFEGRERYPVRVRLLRELRDSPEELGRIFIHNKAGEAIPLEKLARIESLRGPQVIKSEDTRLVSYLTFDSRPGATAIEAVLQASAFIAEAKAEGRFTVPTGVSLRFAGEYEKQQRASARLQILLPLALLMILALLILQFRTLARSLLVFSGVALAFSGGFVLLWLYGLAGPGPHMLGPVDMGNLFHIQPIHLSVAVWVGFIALFGIATDDGVVMLTYLQQSLARHKPRDIKSLRNAVVEAGQRRVRPCLMTTATTLLALLPVLSSTGRGADVMVPMALPVFGGMLMAIGSLFAVPLGFSWLEERRIKKEIGVKH
ncbi:MAG: efflux RND transporter permease subunit [Deltaproteobacteria bacterium]|nr:efflux RND transporter permease subunit [Deltaproteobacteria bacterium]